MVIFLFLPMELDPTLGTAGETLLAEPAGPTTLPACGPDDIGILDIGIPRDTPEDCSVAELGESSRSLSLRSHSFSKP